MARRPSGGRAILALPAASAFGAGRTGPTLGERMVRRQPDKGVVVAENTFIRAARTSIEQVADGVRRGVAQIREISELHDGRG